MDDDAVHLLEDDDIAWVEPCDYCQARGTVPDGGGLERFCDVCEGRCYLPHFCS